MSKPFPTLPPGIPSDAIDTLGVAEILEVSRATVRQYLLWRRTDPRGPETDLPAPAAYLGRSPVWSEETIRAWSEGRPGRGHGRGGRYKTSTTEPRPTGSN